MIRPAVGDQAQTIDQLYGGNAAQWARFDPLTVLAGHAPYPDTAGWFANANATAPAGRGRGPWERPPTRCARGPARAAPGSAATPTAATAATRSRRRPSSARR